MMQFEPISLQEFTAGVAVAAEGNRTKTFVPRFKSAKAEESNEPPPPPPPPTFSEAELKAAKEEGYRTGFNDGEKKGLSAAEAEMAVVNKQIKDLMEPLAGKLTSLFLHYSNFILEQKQATPLLANAIAKKIAGEALAENPMENVERTCVECIDRMLGEAEIHIYVHPALSNMLEEKLSSYFSRSHESGDVLIHKDATLEPSACRVEWKQGGLNFDPTTIISEMDQLALGISGAAEHMHEEVTVDNIEDQIAHLAKEAATEFTTSYHASLTAAAENAANDIADVADENASATEEPAVDAENSLAISTESTTESSIELPTENPAENPTESPIENPTDNPKE